MYRDHRGAVGLGRHLWVGPHFGRNPGLVEVSVVYRPGLYILGQARGRYRCGNHHRAASPSIESLLSSWGDLGRPRLAGEGTDFANGHP